MNRRAAVAIAIAGLAATALAYTASTRQSATFDEIVLVSGGVRGLEHGAWDMVTDQPPLMMYLYGGAARSAAETLPPEDRLWDFDARWDYSRSLFFALGNDTASLLQEARFVSALFAGLLVVAAGGFAWWIAGPLAGSIAALATALLPDVLAHGGVAYNDVPLALGFLLACWALDAGVRKPSPTRAALAAGAVVAAFGMKMSALALGPVAIVLLGAEAWRRRTDAAWRKDAIASGVIGLVAVYVLMVVLYRGDPSLTLFRFNFWRTVLHSTGGHEAPAYLLGRLSEGGFLLYFPVAFFFKTPVAFHALLALGAAGLIGAARARPVDLERVLGWRGRGALLGVVVFGAFLLRSDLNAGFRYALPVLPLLAVLGAVGVSWLSPPRVRNAGVGVLLGLMAVSTLSAHPHYLSYSSVVAGGRDDAHQALVDSNIDWGQGLLELRRFLDAEGETTVRLSYFGSAMPEAYGIEYVELPSFFRLSTGRTAGAEEDPRYTVISATNLHGLYFQGTDPLAAYRDLRPDRVLGHHLFVFDEATTASPR